jgi:acetyl esterase/lipase
MIRRRYALPLLAAGMVAPAAEVQAVAAPETIPLWPDVPPGGGPGPARPERVGDRGQIEDVHLPRLILHRPATPNGRAVVVVAGGGYRSISLGKESGPATRWLSAQGVTAFELIYRLPGEGWAPDAPFADGARAIRLLRAQAARFGIDADRIGMLGFSAGAHLVGMTAVGASRGRYSPVDAADALSSRPDCAGLIYPVLTMMPPWNRTQAFRRLLGDGASPATCAAYSVERQLHGDCPPLFLAQAADDPVSPVENSLLTFAAARQAGLLPEMHVFRQGGHGWGMGAAGSETAAWPQLYSRWAQEIAAPTLPSR